MKRLISLSLLLSSALCGHAQDVNKTLTLDEVTVQAAKVVNKADGLLIYPTDAQRQASNNGFSILEKLSLANLRIDHVNHAVTAIDNRGEVQLRVNGVVVGKQEMLALDPKDVVKIDFINNPGSPLWRGHSLCRRYRYAQKREWLYGRHRPDRVAYHLAG